MKKIMTLLLAAALAMSCTACFGRNSTSSNQNPSVQSGTQNMQTIDEQLKNIDGVVSVEKHELTDNMFRYRSAYDFTFKSGDLTLGGYLSVPDDYATIDYPTVIYLPGGAPSQEKSAEKFTLFGTITFTFIMRGTEPSEGVKDLGGKDFADTEALYNIIKKISYVNTEKLYVAAASEQSINALKLCAEHNDIQGVAIDTPLVDLAKTYEGLTAEKQEYFKTLLGGTPQEVPEEYESRSAVTFADKITCPVLLMEYEQLKDSSATIECSKKFVETLKANGVTAEFKSFNEDGSDFSGSSLGEALHWMNIV